MVSRSSTGPTSAFRSSARSTPRLRPGGGSVSLTNGVIEIGRHQVLDDLSAFTIEATVTPKAIGPQRQNIIEGQSPGIALFISPEGKLVGSMSINGAWTGLDSGAVTIAANTPTAVRFTRDEAGKTDLMIGGQVVASKSIPGTIQKAGEFGFKVGAWVDGQKWPFDGTVGDLSIRSSAVAADFLKVRVQKAQAIEASVAHVLKRVHVSLIPDESYARLQPVKDIMNAAGVQKLSDLQTLRITTKTVVTSGMVLVAGKKSPPLVWAEIATKFRAATALEKQSMLAQVLTNQNSQKILTRAVTSPPAGGVVSPGVVDPGPAVNPGAVVNPGVLANPGAAVTAAVLVNPGAGVTPGFAHAGAVIHPGLFVNPGLAGGPGRAINPGIARRDGADMAATLRSPLGPHLVRHSAIEFVRFEGGVLRVDPGLLVKVADRNPINWVDTAAPEYHFITLKTIPINTAVDHRRRTRPHRDSARGRAEREDALRHRGSVICGNNAAISWRQPRRRHAAARRTTPTTTAEVGPAFIPSRIRVTAWTARQRTRRRERSDWSARRSCAPPGNVGEEHDGHAEP